MFGIIIENPNHYLLMAQQWPEVLRQTQLLALNWLGAGPITLLLGNGFIPDARAWFNGGLPIFLVAALGLGFLHFWAVHRNPLTALRSTFGAFFGALWDFVRLPFGLRRILAIAKVSALEAVRGQVLYVFGLFLLPMAFAGWYLPKTDEGALLYLVGYVNTAITYTLLPMAAFLVSMSLPKDIQNKVIQTVVTKPVRRLEIVVGRILGFTAVFTFVLLLMAAASLAFLWSQLTPKQRENYWVARAAIYANRMPEDARADAVRSMVNDSRMPPDMAKARVEQMEAAYPLMFKKREGWDIKGVNVGKEWFGQRWHTPGAYNSQSYAVLGFKFNHRDVAVETDDAGKKFVRVFAECDIFKTNKGDARREADVGKDAEGSGVFGELTVKNGAGESYVKSFAADHTRAVQLLVPYELFANDKAEMWLRCLTPSQFLGVGRSDLYFLTGETSFAVNFLKAMSSVWLKLFFLIVVAVAASAALKGFVAVLATASVLTLGTFWHFVSQIADVGERSKNGGGPLESLWRLVTQTNLVNPLDEGFMATMVVNVDAFVLAAMQKLSFLVPNLADLDTIEYVARGVDLPWALVARNALFVATFALPAVVAGHLVLKHRELAAT